MELPYLTDRQRCAVPKRALVTRKRVKGRKARAEQKVKDAVRAACVTRDGYCRTGCGDRFGDVNALLTTLCDGPSEWAHMHSRRRSKTRGKAPADRHDTAHSLMLCRKHHDAYDGRSPRRLFITALTRKGAGGPLKFRRAK